MKNSTIACAWRGEKVFQARARARKSKDQPYRFAVFGDCGAGTPEERAVAYQTYKARPDFVFIPGDIVYSRGRISEYRTKYFPISMPRTPLPRLARRCCGRRCSSRPRAITMSPNPT